MTRSDQILSVSEMAAAERSAIESGCDGYLLMERAGEGIVRALQGRWTRRPVAVLCGPGNNGGDGYVAARLLKQAGWAVRVLAEASPVRAEAARAATAWAGEIAPLTPASLSGAELIVDALYGVGASRPLSLAAEAVLREVAERSLPILAVDLPSGLPGDASSGLGFAPNAVMTVTFHAKKPAHVLWPGRDLCGDIIVADIGLDASEGRLWENGPDLWLERFPWPKVDAHKHKRGRLAVVSGPAWSTGAARLAARAGLRIGAGLVTVLSPPGAVGVNASHLEAVMLQPFETDMDLERAAERADAVVIGPGAGVTPDTALNLIALARTGAALVVDADVFTVFRDDPDGLFSALDRDDVLTPHEGEFERVFPGLLVEHPNRIAAARAASARAGAVVLLKGPDTVIAAPDGRAAVNTNATPWLATAGSGDVLAGMIAGLVAQGMDSFEAACAAAWIHAEAGRGFGPGLIAEDLPDLTPGILRTLYG